MNRNRRPSAPPACEIAMLRMELLHIEPLIWRQLEVPTMMTLGALHEIIQAAMCWSDSHLWELTVDGRRYGMPDDDDLGDETLEDADEALLDSLLTPRPTTVGYVYDFGDNWELRLTLTNRRFSAPNTAYPRYIGGERNAPQEYCGGVHGLHQLPDAISAPSKPDHPAMPESD